MLDDFHAIGILGILVCGVLLAAGCAVGLVQVEFGIGKRGALLAVGISALAALGICSALLLNARGAPLIEWLLPLAMFALVGPFLKSARTQAIFGGVMFAAALGLCFSFTELMARNYAISLDPATAAKNRSILHIAAKKIEALPAGQVPAGPVASLVDGPLGRPTVVTPQPLWHTWFTRLRERKEATVWSPGGDVAFVAKNLEIRPD
jgi:hypothetical protein